MNLYASEIAALVGGRLVGNDTAVQGVGTDTRSLASSALFVALRGERFDGHEFVRRAASLGAVAALVDRQADVPLAQIVVADTLTALQRLAAAWRLRCPARVFAVTGSNGKTTVKEMLSAILRQGASALATRGNLNNHIGVPLTLLELESSHDYAVIELGANHPGEIALLTRLVRPNAGVITNAADAHLQGFGSREGVARAKGELFADLAADGNAVINADDHFAPLWAELAGDRRQVTFGMAHDADVRARAIEYDGALTRFRLVTPDGEAAVELPLAGRHNVANALAAAAASWSMNLPLPAIAAGLGETAPVAGRLQRRITKSGAVLIDDSYNANPSSLAAALEVLVAEGECGWLVLGDMGELGEGAEAAHAEAGRAARKAGVGRLFAVGELSAAAVHAFGEGARHFPDRDALIAALLEDLCPGVTLLVKGSRAAAMEQVVAALEPGQQQVNGEGAPC